MKKKILILLLVVLALTFCAQIYTTTVQAADSGGNPCCKWKCVALHCWEECKPKCTAPWQAA